VLQGINEEEVDRLARLIHDRGATMVAVCLLHSYANPAHEQQLATLLRQSGLAVCTSHEVLPEYREFERWSTTVVNANDSADGQVLGTLERTFTPARLPIMQSTEGAYQPERARRRCAPSPAGGGVVGAAWWLAGSCASFRSTWAHVHGRQLDR
jgi:N-methylhydantoinase A/oxoprolinase/acetone carboxylase beta subunit